MKRLVVCALSVVVAGLGYALSSMNELTVTCESASEIHWSGRDETKEKHFGIRFVEFDPRLSDANTSQSPKPHINIISHDIRPDLVVLRVTSKTKDIIYYDYEFGRNDDCFSVSSNSCAKKAERVDPSGFAVRIGKREFYIARSWMFSGDYSSQMTKSEIDMVSLMMPQAFSKCEV